MPITLRHRFITKDGSTETHDVVMHGRAFSLQKILDRTLCEQEAAGVLRPMYPESRNVEAALEDLRSKGM